MGNNGMEVLVEQNSANVGEESIVMGEETMTMVTTKNGTQGSGFGVKKQLDREYGRSG